MMRGSSADPASVRKTALADLLDKYAREVPPLKRGHAVERIRLAFLGYQPEHIAQLDGVEPSIWQRAD